MLADGFTRCLAREKHTRTRKAYAICSLYQYSPSTCLWRQMPTRPLQFCYPATSKLFSITMPSYEERFVLNNLIIQNAAQPKEHQEPIKSAWFRKLSTKVDKISTTISSLNFDTLVQDCSKRISRSEAEHSTLGSQAQLVTTSTKYSTTDSKDLVYFWKQGLDVPFGPKVAREVREATENAIDELALEYPPPQPKRPDTPAIEDGKPLKQHMIL